MLDSSYSLERWKNSKLEEVKREILETVDYLKVATTTNERELILEHLILLLETKNILLAQSAPDNEKFLFWCAASIIIFIKNKLGFVSWISDNI